MAEKSGGRESYRLPSRRQVKGRPIRTASNNLPAPSRRCKNRRHRRRLGPPAQRLPYALLVDSGPEADAAAPRAGRLKIFFGATPGVGKTHAMLDAARALRRSGADIVAGWVDTRGRAELV